MTTGPLPVEAAADRGRPASASGVVRFVRQRPVSVGLAVLTAALAVAGGSPLAGPGPALRQAVALDIGDLLAHGRLGSLLTSVLFAGSAAELLLVLAALVVVVGACERLIGSARTAVAWLVTAVAGGLVGTALQAAGLLARGVWATPPITTLVLHPETPVLGVLLTASACTGPFWRRRIRLVGFAALIVLLLYSGQPEDLDHLAGAAAGLVLGLLLTRRAPRLVFPRSSHHEARTLLAALVAVAAIGPIVAVLQPRGYGLLRPLGRLFRDPVPLADRVRAACPPGLSAHDCERAAQLVHLSGPGAALLAVLPLAVLLVAAAGIRRGRRAGAWLAVGVNLLLALLGGLAWGLPSAPGARAGSVTAQSVLAVLVPLAVAVAVLLQRRRCPVLPTRRALRGGAVAVAAGAVAAAGLHLGVGLLVRQQFAPAATPLALLAELPERFVPGGFLGLHRLRLVPIGPVSSLLEGWIGTGAWAVLLVAAVVVVRSARTTSGAREQARLRALLRTGAAGSISWMTTWPGNRTWFSPDGRHAVAYREAAGVALTLGEPVGPQQGAAEAARAFALHCDDQGLVPAFWTVRPEFVAVLGDRGAPWASVEVGEDAVIDPRAFSLRGRHWQDVRSSFNRAARAGIRAEWTDWHALPGALRAQVEAIGEEWLAERRLPELGFTLGGTEQVKDREVRLMLAVGPGDRVEAVTSWLPTWRDGEVVGLTLDLMRRRGDAPNGVMEFVIASAIGVAAQRGMEFVSLSVAPLQGVDADSDDRVERLLAGMARRLEPVYGFRSLAAYKGKFRPACGARVLAFPDPVALPAIAVAVARAYLPGSSLDAIGQVRTALRPEEREGSPTGR